MTRRIFLSILSVSVAVCSLCFAIGIAAFYETYSQQRYDELTSQTLLLAEVFEQDEDIDPEALSTLDAQSYRITLIGKDGDVIRDSSADVSLMENHLDREEVQEALSGKVGFSTHNSESLKETSDYCAVLLSDGSVLRLSVTHRSFIYLIASMWVQILGITALMCALSLLLARVLTRKILQPLMEYDPTAPAASPAAAIYPELAPFLDRIAAQQSRLAVQNEELRRSERIRREFSANVSHELKTPLQSIMGYTELLHEGMVQDEDLQLFYDRLYREAKRLDLLVKDIVDLSSLDEGAVDLIWEDVDIAALIREVVDDLAPFAAQREVALSCTGEFTCKGPSSNNAETSCKEAPLTVYAQRRLLHDLIFNLVDNAIKYNVAHGSVNVGLTRTDQKTILTVKDTGIGMAEEEIPRVFERFYRIDKSRSCAAGVSGTGLGLSIVKHAALILHAELELESTLGVGTEVRVIFL